VQLAAVEVLRQFDEVEVAKKLVERWRALAPAVRGPVINVLLQRVTFHGVLIDALESGRLTLGELNLDLEQRRRLLWESTPDLKGRAGRLMGDGEYANRKAVVEDWLKRLPASGDVARGRAVFEKACAQCHALDGVGHQVGPDLAAQAHRSVEDLLSNILDPNMAINSNYAGYTVETVTGEIESGILRSESADAVELLQALSRKIVVPRKQVKRLESSGISLMPEGLESGLTPAELRDLISFLQVKR
jgi:putative heme-binding domain-containing protein